jgi:prephenate dehydrogenase
VTTARPHDGCLTGPVRVVGAGLLGTSVALALRAAGLEVRLADLVEEHVRTAVGLGAGAPDDGGRAQLVVVAVPPDHLASVITEALTRDGAVVTDVGSVKAAPLAQVAQQVDASALARYVGGHPMAGSERSGPLAASAALFDGRPWAVTPHEGSDPDAVRMVRELALLCAATPVTFTPEEHDHAVARTSHLPHVVAALVAGTLVDAPRGHLTLSGQGVRDVTRIAAGDPGLWEQILTANVPAVAGLLRSVRDDLDVLLDALESGSRPTLHDILGHGVAGTRVIPGKHGRPVLEETGVFVVVPDHPGELARLFAAVGDIGVNVEDVRIDHDPGRPVGVLELTVAASRAEHLVTSLTDRGWRAHR